MTLEQIKGVVKLGLTVCHNNEAYEVQYWENQDAFRIVCILNDYAIGLTWRDGVTMNGKEKDFFVKNCGRAL